MSALTAEALFEKYFWPLYPPSAQQELAHARAEDANPGNNPGIFAHLSEAAELFVKNSEALLGVSLGFDPRSVALFSSVLTQEKRDEWLAKSPSASPENLLFNTVVHGSAFVGEVAVRCFGAKWSARNPLWESVVLRKIPTGTGVRHGGAIPPLHWVLKALSDQELGKDTLAQRFRVYIELPSEPLEGLSVLHEPGSLPKLKAPNYDLLVKYIHQHLPGLKDLGTGFPKPAEFTARSYESLSFSLFHEGKVLAIHGLAPAQGTLPPMVEVLWITSRGFHHADSLPCDPTPPHFARAVGDALEITLAWKTRPHTHTLRFSGHT